jgi:hypothetical protein
MNMEIVEGFSSDLDFLVLQSEFIEGIGKKAYFNFYFITISKSRSVAGVLVAVSDVLRFESNSSLLG